MSESLKWIKSSYSASGNCVEVAARDHGNRVLVRDTKDRTGPDAGVARPAGVGSLTS